MSAARVLLITARADVGGGPRHVDLLLRHLPEDVDRWAACPDEPPYAEAWRRLPGVLGWAPIPRRKFSVAALWRLSRFCAAHKINIVHSHGKGAGVYGRLLKLLRPSVKTVHTFHGVHVGQYGAAARAVYLRVERFLSRFTDAFVNVSEGEKAQCLALGLSTEEKTRVIPNGIPPLAPPDGEAVSHLKMSGKRIVLTLARFEFQKNMAAALAVAASARRAHPDWVFLWAGDGPELPALRQRAKDEGLDNVVFLGFTDRGPDLLAAADVFLTTSLWEGLPYALVEASAAGLPIVASRVTGNDEVVFPGENGLLFSVDAPAEALARLEEVLGDPALRLRLSEGGKRVYERRFTVGKSVESLRALYGAVLEGR